jgi:hypothetical protein
MELTEHKKIDDNQELFAHLMEFVEWLEYRYTIVSNAENRIQKGPALVYRFLNVDVALLEEERRYILELQRQKNRQ